MAMAETQASCCHLPVVSCHLVCLLCHSQFLSLSSPSPPTFWALRVRAPPTTKSNGGCWWNLSTSSMVYGSKNNPRDHIKSKFLVRSRNLRAFADSLITSDLKAILVEEEEGDKVLPTKEGLETEEVKEENNVLIEMAVEFCVLETLKEAGEGEEEVERFERIVNELKEYQVKDDERNNLQGSDGVNDDSFRSSESETSFAKASTSDSDENQTISKSPPQWHGFFKSLKKRSAKMNFQNIPPFNVPKLRRRKSSKRSSTFSLPTVHPDLDVKLYQYNASWKMFTLLQLQSATDHFSHDNLIGEGGYSEVYKGQLEDGMLVAIKRLCGGTAEEMIADFLSELGIIVHADHPNIAKLIGYSVDGGLHLVLQLSPHGSLASFIRGSKEKLDWRIRYKIALGTAVGLVYLHEGCHRRIIHKDIKAANILLTEDFEPQISDFGLAKWLPDQCTHHILSQFEGTFGYFPPEFFMHGIVDEKTDMYAYGVLLLELITGRLALDDSQKSLVMWAKPLLAKNNMEKLIDPCIADSYNLEEMRRVVLTASFCVHQSSICRPQAHQALQILRGDEGSLELAKQLGEHNLPIPNYEDLFGEDECNPAECLNEVCRDQFNYLNDHKLNVVNEHRLGDMKDHQMAFEV